MSSQSLAITGPPSASPTGPMAAVTSASDDAAAPSTEVRAPDGGLSDLFPQILVLNVLDTHNAQQSTACKCCCAHDARIRTGLELAGLELAAGVLNHC